MALIKCPECLKEISDKAVACPDCGFPVANHINQIGVVQNGAGKTEQEILKEKQVQIELRVKAAKEQYVKEQAAEETVSTTKPSNSTRNLGICIMIVGVIWGVIAFNMKTSIETESKTIGSGLYSMYVPSQTVHNLDLADQRRNHMMGAAIALLSGILFFGFGSIKSNSIIIGP